MKIFFMKQAPVGKIQEHCSIIQVTEDEKYDVLSVYPQGLAPQKKNTLSYITYKYQDHTGFSWEQAPVCFSVTERE